MKTKKLTGLISVLFILFGLSTTASAIPIVNSSFEDNQPPNPVATPWKSNPNGTYATGLLNGWTISGTGGTWQPSTIPFPSGVQDGTNVAFVNSGASIFQALNPVADSLARLTQDLTYTLSVYVGQRASEPSKYGWGYTDELLAGGTVIATENTLTPGAGNFALSEITYTADAFDPYLGYPIVITVQNPPGL